MRFLNPSTITRKRNGDKGNPWHMPFNA